MRIHRLDGTHVPCALALTDSVDWTFSRDDFSTMLASGELHGHCSPAGDLITCAGFFPYGPSLASIGAVMVKPEFQKRGLGQELMAHVHARPIAQGRTLMLVATVEGIRLYNKMGYKEMGRLRKMKRSSPIPRASSSLSGIQIRTAADDDLDFIIKLDAEAVGVHRNDLIVARWKQAYRAAVAVDRAGDRIGFALATDQRGNLVFGPVVAPGVDVVLHLLHEAGGQHAGQLRIHVPEHKRALWSALFDLGFEQETRSPIMVCNGDRLPGYGPTMWGIAAQAFG